MRYEKDFFNRWHDANWEDKHWLEFEEFCDLKDLYESKVFRPFALFIAGKIEKNEIFEAKFLLGVADGIACLLHAVGDPSIPDSGLKGDELENMRMEFWSRK